MEIRSMTDDLHKAVKHHHYHSFLNRGIYSLTLAVAVLSVGTLGFHWIEGFPYIDSFYFASMIATGQGPAPNTTPATALGKLFTCLFAFVSVGSMIAALGFVFGPFLGKLWRIGVIKLEEELHLIKPKKGSKL